MCRVQEWEPAAVVAFGSLAVVASPMARSMEEKTGWAAPCYRGGRPRGKKWRARIPDGIKLLAAVGFSARGGAGTPGGRQRGTVCPGQAPPCPVESISALGAVAHNVRRCSSGHHKLLGLQVGGQLGLVGVARLGAALVAKRAVRLVQLAWRREGRVGEGARGGWMRARSKVTHTRKGREACRRAGWLQAGAERAPVVQATMNMLLQPVQHSPRMAASASVSVLLPISTLRTWRGEQGRGSRGQAVGSAGTRLHALA